MTLPKPLLWPYLSLPQGEPMHGRTAEGAEEPCTPQHTHRPQKAPFGRAVQETNPCTPQSLKENLERGNGPVRQMVKENPEGSNGLIRQIAISEAREQKGLHLVIMNLTCSDTWASLWVKPLRCFLSFYLHY